MKSTYRSQSTKKLSFPIVAPKEPATGNERITFMAGEVPVTMVVPPKGFTATSLVHGFLDAKSGSIPYIAVVVSSRDREGVIKFSQNLLKPANLQPTGEKAGLAIMHRLFPNFYKVLKAEPRNQKAQTAGLALDCASIFKNPSEMGQIQLENEGQWKAWVNAQRRSRKPDELDYLLANYYMAKGWDKMRMAEVGKICGKILKRKPFPASTIKDRTTALDLQTTLKAGA